MRIQSNPRKKKKKKEKKKKKTELGLFTADRHKFQPIPAERSPPSPLVSPQSCRVLVPLCAVVRGGGEGDRILREGASQPASLCVCVPLPPTTTCTGFKASSLQPASGDEKLPKLTFRGGKKRQRQKEKERRKKSKVGSSSLKPCWWEDTKRASVKQTSRSESAALHRKHV